MVKNVLDYVKRAGLMSFDDLPLTEVDLAAFTQLVYLPYELAFEACDCPTLAQAAEEMADVEADKFYNVYYRKRLELMRLMAELPRYEGLVISAYVKEIDPVSEMQFCAMTFRLPDGSLVISYEGTDNTLVGWKEDFNMSFVSPVPAQKAARDYLHDTAYKNPYVPLILTGHSKGGNLAVWAAAFADAYVQGRIRGIYSFDGPGLMDQDADSESYAAVSDRIHAYLPQNSLVGILMRRHVPDIVVKSEAFSVMQHDLFTWEVEPEGYSFIRMEGLKLSARLRDEVLGEWLNGVSLDEREVFCESIYKVLTADESRETLEDLLRMDMDAVSRSVRAAREIDPTTRKMIRRALSQLLTGSIESIVEAAKEAVLESRGLESIVGAAKGAKEAVMEALPVGKGKESEKKKREKAQRLIQAGEANEEEDDTKREGGF